MMRWISVLALVLTAAVFAQERPSKKSLAELAEETRNKKNYSGKVRVITNSDLKHLTANVSTGGRTEPVNASPDHPANAPGEESGPSDPTLSAEELQELKADFDDARAELKMAVNEGLVLQLRMNQVRNAYLNRSDGAMQQRLQALMAETDQRIEGNRQAQEAAREAVKKLQEKARKAGLTSREIEELTGKLPEASVEIGTPESGPN